MSVTKLAVSRLRAFMAVVATFCLVTASLTATVQTASADTSPPSGSPATVSADALPTVQVDGVVWAQVTVGNVVYATGSFAFARPAGTAANSSSRVARANLLAYDITTGNLITTFNHSLNAQGRAIAASPDGTRVYVAGDFSSVDGVARGHLVGFDTATGAVASLSANLNGNATAVTASNSTVYVGGRFTAAAGNSRARLAAYTSAGGLTTWNPGADASVTALVMSPDQSRVIVGGQFTVLAGAARNSIGSVLTNTTATNGTPGAWPADFIVKNSSTSSTISSLSSDGTSVFGTGYYFMRGGNFEGRFAVVPNTGALLWMNSCHGDTYNAYPIGNVLYSSGHEHDCSDILAFAQDQSDTFASTHHFAAAETTNATGTLQAPVFGGMYFSFAGQPSATQLDWYPTFTPGTYTGQNQATWSVTGNTSYVSYGGEFPTVNGTAQNGLVRFAVRSIAPNKIGPETFAAPRAISQVSGTARISWQADWDEDNSNLTYLVYRDGGSTAITSPISYSSTFGNRPILGYTDTGLTPGSSHTYAVRVTDPLGNTRLSAASSAVTISSGSRGSYATTIRSDGAQNFWPLSEASGTTANDNAGFTDLTLRSGVSFGASGPVPANGTAATFSGTSTSTSQQGFPGAPPRVTTTSNSVASSAGNVVPLSSFTLEAWVKTTSTAGGTVIGDSLYQPSSPGPDGGQSPLVDRVLYFGNDGKVNFGVINSNGVKQTVTSPAAYNDGAWHLLAASVGNSGAQLSVDGQSVATDSAIASSFSFFGHWRLGGDTLTGWSNAPTSAYLAGAMADVAIYPSVLSGSQLTSHFQAAGITTNAKPTAAFTSSCTDLGCSFDGSGSSDTDGQVSSYAWDFGDATATGTGATPTHAYTAANTYTVTLTVTDNQGASGSISHTVSPTAPADATFASDAFNRTVGSGFGTADQGGAWTVSSASNTSVAPGNGLIRLATAGASQTALLNGATSNSSDLTTTFSADKVANSGGGVYLVAVGRRVSTNEEYNTQIRIAPSGALSVSILKYDGSSTPVTISASTAVSGVTYTAGSKLNVRFQVYGTSPTTLRVKVWAAGTAERATWARTVTDSSAAIQAAGAVGVRPYLSGTATNNPVTIGVSSFAAKPVA